MYGVINNYNPKKDYGTIFVRDFQSDIFFYISEWQNRSQPELGQLVEFDIMETELGAVAVSIVVVDPNKPPKQRTICPKCTKSVIPNLYNNKKGAPEYLACPFCQSTLQVFGKKSLKKDIVWILGVVALGVAILIFTIMKIYRFI